MSELQVTTLEANLAYANTIVAGNSVVNNSGLYLGNSTAIINTSAIRLSAAEYGGAVSGNNVIQSNTSFESITFPSNQLPVPDFSSNTAGTANNWSAVNSTLEPYSNTHPEGKSVYIFKESLDSVANTHYAYFDNYFPWYNNPNVVPHGTTYVCQFDAKPAGRNVLFVQGWGNYAVYFGLSQNNPYSLVGAVSNPQASMKYLGDGWYRCYVTTICENPSNLSPTYFGLFPYFYTIKDDLSSSYIGNGSSGILLSNFKSYRSVTSLETVNTQIFTANGTWSKPGWANTGNELVVVHAWGGGGGGGSGASNPGGGGGAFVFGYYKASQLGTTANVVVGGGGAVGVSGGNSAFANSTGGLFTAYGGGSGNNSGFGGGGGWLSAGTAGAAGGPIAGNTTITTSTFGGGMTNSISSGQSIYGGGSGSNNVVAGNSIFGGGGGSRGGPIGVSIFGGSGGNNIVSATIPGGGGGRNASGARGEVRVYTYRILNY